MAVHCIQMDSDACASQGTRQKTQKSLRSGKKVAPKLDDDVQKKKRSWESWSFEDKYEARDDIAFDHVSF